MKTKNAKRYARRKMVRKKNSEKKNQMHLYLRIAGILKMAVLAIVALLWLTMLEGVLFDSLNGPIVLITVSSSARLIMVAVAAILEFPFVGLLIQANKIQSEIKINKKKKTAHQIKCTRTHECMEKRKRRNKRNRKKRKKKKKTEKKTRTMTEKKTKKMNNKTRMFLATIIIAAVVLYSLYSGLPGGTLNEESMIPKTEYSTHSKVQVQYVTVRCSTVHGVHNSTSSGIV